MNKYFGQPWNETIRDLEQVPVPVGHCCMWCEEEFVENDQGLMLSQGQVLTSDDNQVFNKLTPTYLAAHVDCFLRQIIGSVGHQTKKCSCFGGDFEDPPEMSKREAATAAVELFRQTNERK